jgi:hypothetical protein
MNKILIIICIKEVKEKIYVVITRYIGFGYYGQRIITFYLEEVLEFEFEISHLFISRSKFLTILNYLNKK